MLYADLHTCTAYSTLHIPAEMVYEHVCERYRGFVMRSAYTSMTPGQDLYQIAGVVMFR